MGLDKDKLIKNMTDNLPMLRTRIGLSQVALGKKVGISRSTVFAIESHRNKMTWSTFLALVLLFIKNKETNKLLNTLEIYTDELNDFLKRNINSRYERLDVIDDSVLSKLDDESLMKVKKLIIEEYAKNSSSSTEEIIKFFEGNKFLVPKSTEEDAIIKAALKNIKEKE